MLALVIFFAFPAAALELKPIEVVPGVYAVIGDLGPPTAENEGLNANLGFVVGNDYVVVIDTGPSVRVARAFHDAIRRVTDKPVRWAINTNSQGHRWLGNRYFAEIGARIVAHEKAVATMRDQGGMQLAAMRGILAGKAEGTEITVPKTVFSDRFDLDPGGVSLKLLHFGPAHTRGDTVVWLSQKSILFAGDLIYTDRLLAILPAGSSVGWISAFDSAEKLRPRIILPGHGAVADLHIARRETRDYLVDLRAAMRPLVKNGVPLPDAIGKVDQSRYRYLANFAELARRNAQQVYLELELE